MSYEHRVWRAGFAGVDGKVLKYVVVEESVHQQQSEMFCFEFTFVFVSLCRAVMEN